jgi:hypothetical protein
MARHAPAMVAAFLLTSALGVHPPPPPILDLNGACAGVKTREEWKDSAGKHHWSYKVKAKDWTVFGRIHVTMHGWDMQLTQVYYGYVENQAGARKDYDVLLHPQAGPDNVFEIQGDGEPFADPDLTCNLQAFRSRAIPTALLRPPHVCPLNVMLVCAQRTNASELACALGPKFEVESDWDSIQSGRFRAHVHMDMWCAPMQ